SVLGAAGLLRDDAEVEPIDGRSLSFNRRMKIVQRFGKALLSIGDKAEQMERFWMIGREFECLTVSRFRLRQAMRLLMEASLFEPRFDRRRRALAWCPSCRFLTASLGSIHDASAAAVLRVAENSPNGQRRAECVTRRAARKETERRYESHKISG